jgi:uncharacterized protein with NAD-binding domain and iron-sulfur cluster
MISIFGAGISGLTCALELVKQGFKVKIYEKEDLPGGMAKSKRINGIPSEHSWRGYTKFYNNIFDILEQTPIKTEYFTVDDVSKHNKPDDAWIIYKNNVYDITNFIDKHPGGQVIINALGKDVEKVWSEYHVQWHIKNESVQKKLETYKIGSLEIKENFQNLTALNNINNGLSMELFNDKPTPKSIFTLIYDLPSLAYHFFVYSTSNLRSKKYYSTRLLDYLENKVSKYTYDYIINTALGPGLGLDKNNCSAGLLFHYLNLDLSAANSGYESWSVMKKPTSEAFINPLVTLLKSKGVEFIYNCDLKKINFNNNIISNCIITKTTLNGILVEETINSDDYVIAINPNNCYEIFNNSNMTKLAKQHKKLEITNNQISFRLGFKNKINFKSNRSGIVILDSPYNITFYPQENFFNVPIDTNKKINSLWSGTCIQTYNNGILFNKPATSINKDQLIEEIIAQILRCEELQNEIKELNGKILEKNDIIHTEIWDDWYWNGTNLESKNKKWVNTVYNEPYKPRQNTDYKNLYLAGAHTKNSLKIWSMESACESGKRAANFILKKNNLPLCKYFVHKKPSYFTFFEKYDDYLFKKKLPGIIDIFIFVLVIFILSKILK